MAAPGASQNGMLGEKTGPNAVRRLLGAVVMAVVLLVHSQPARASIEALNRWVFGLNQSIAESIVKPGVDGYRRAIPETVRARLYSAYENLIEPATALGHAIEADLESAANSSARFIINSTAGILGTNDIATRLGFPKDSGTFAAAYCRSGLPLGDFVVLPLAGPTTAGIAVAGTALMVGSIYILGLLAIELAVAGIAIDMANLIDMVGSVVAVETALSAGASEPISYETQRRAFLQKLQVSCER